MGKKVKVQYTKDIKFEVDPHVWDLCHGAYAILLQAEALPGTSAMDKSTNWYAEVYQGGVGQEKAKEIVRKNSLFYFPIIEPGYRFVLAEVKKHGVGKRPKKDKGNQSNFNADFVYRMCEFVVSDTMKSNPGSQWNDYFKDLKKKYNDLDRAKKRLSDRAQIHSTVARALLAVLETKGELPKQAFAK